MNSALSLPVPCSAGSIDQYIGSVNRLPMLSEQEERDLATRLKEHGDLDAARHLVACRTPISSRKAISD